MYNNFAILGVGTTELLLILGIIVLLFGGKKLPELARSLGESFSELKKSAGPAREIKQEVTGQVRQVKETFASSDKRV
jgi:sec-independent protein translocase protein TatA